MESYELNVCGRNDGQLFQHKTKSPANGPIFTILNKSVLPGRTAGAGPFKHLAFHKNGYQLAASDSIGNIFVFDFMKKKFWHLFHLGINCCTSLAFTFKSNLIVGISDCSIAIWNIDRCKCVKSVSNHKKCVHHISINDDGTRAITSSIEEAIMWDLSSKFHMLYKLADGPNTFILKVFFLHKSNDIVCAFKTSFVCLWNSENLKHKMQFLCSEEPTFWLKAIEGSKDGSVIACAGKSNIVMLYKAETGSLLHQISFANQLNYVCHILLLSNQNLKTNEDYNSLKILSVLDQNGQLHLYDLMKNQHINHELVNLDEPIETIFEFKDKLAFLMSSGKIKLYNITSLFEEPVKYKPKVPATTVSLFLKTKGAKISSEKKKKIHTISLTNIKDILLESNEYPTSYRPFIWAQLLSLPKNNGFVNYYNEADINLSSLGTKYNDVNESCKKALARQLSMLIKWCPFLKEVDYLPDLIFPFVRVLFKWTRMCFELLVTLICNWCQNWFLYLPFPPYNILYAVENLLVYFDRPLLHHFLMHRIQCDVYVFSILQSSFSKIFTGDQWLQLWDHIFSNPPCFILFVAVAFLILSRNVLFQCKTQNDFHMYYSQNNVLVSNVLDKAYDLASSNPECFNAHEIIGSFTPLPEGGYPPFTNFTPLEANFQKLNRQRIIDGELEHANRFLYDLKILDLKQLQNMAKIREVLLIESLKQKDIDERVEIEKKVGKVQNLITKHLVTPMISKVSPPKEERKSSNCAERIRAIHDLREKLLQDE